MDLPADLFPAELAAAQAAFALAHPYEPAGAPIEPPDFSDEDMTDYDEDDAERAFAAWESEYDHNARG